MSKCELPLADAMHQLNAHDCDCRVSEPLEAEHHGNALLNAPMVLLKLRRLSAVVAADLDPADQGDTSTMPGTLASAAEHLAAVNAAPTPEAPAELIADKGYHSRAALKALDG